MNANEIRIEIARLVKFTSLKTFGGLGLAPLCDRCGGSGRRARSQSRGTVCPKCSGNGKVMPEFTATLLEKVQQKVASGEVNAYLEQIAARKAK